jgi:hypothetical protein
MPARHMFGEFQPDGLTYMGRRITRKEFVKMDPGKIWDDLHNTDMALCSYDYMIINPYGLLEINHGDEAEITEKQFKKKHKKAVEKAREEVKAFRKEQKREAA